MILGAATLALAGTLALAAFVGLSRLDARWRQGSWLLPSYLVLGLVLASCILLRTPLEGLSESWNGCRLAPVVSLTRGYTLYYTADEGPILNLIYGPLAALAYFPVLAGASSTWMVLLGVGLSILYIVLPLFVCHWRLRGTDSEAVLRALVASVVTFLALSFDFGTRYWYRNVHADAPVLGFGLLACACLLGDPGRQPLRSLGLASLFTALALFTKQTAIGIPLGLAAWLWVARGGRPALQYALGVLACCAVLGLLSMAVFGPAALYFNMITVPSRHPWEKPGLKGLLWALSEAMGYVLAPALILVPACVLLVRRKIRSDRRRLRDQVASAPWTLFLSVAVCLIPTSLLGRIKVGGQSNSFHFVLYLYCAASVSLLQTTSEPESGRSTAFMRKLLMAAATPVLAWAGWTLSQEDPPVALFSKNSYTESDALERKYPGQIYFPYNPLCTLLHESRLYHFDYGVYDRVLAGFPPSDPHLRAYLPPNLKYMAWEGPLKVVRSRLPEFSPGRKRSDPAANGWKIVEASGPEGGR